MTGMDSPHLTVPAVPLRSITVIPVATQDFRRWDELIVSHHYLGTRGLVCEQIRHVAIDAQGQWLALLGWASAVLKCQVRDRWIGWLPSQQWRRLPLLANNTRFLVLPWVRQPHLASRVLALSVRRLSADWRRQYDHNVLLAETFVDGTRFRGTCYRAAGWQVLGHTRGFSRHSGRYQTHGQPKMVLVKALHPQACQILRDAAPPTAFLPQETHCDPLALRMTGPGSLKEALAVLTDQRSRCRMEHRDFPGLLTLIAMAQLAGKTSSREQADYIAHLPSALLFECGCRVDLRPYRVRPPSATTVRRIIAMVQAERLLEITNAWTSSLVSDGGDDEVDDVDEAPQEEAAAAKVEMMGGRDR